MSGFYRGESGSPGRLAPFFPQRTDRPRDLAAVILLIPIAYSPSQRLRAPLICSLTSHNPAKRAPVRARFTVSRRLSYFTFVMNPPKWDSCIPGTSRKGDVMARKINSLANPSLCTYFSYVSGPFHHPTSFRQIPPFFLPLRL
jgi:hypothetical protein